jgi:hypothetical protein
VVVAVAQVLQGQIAVLEQVLVVCLLLQLLLIQIQLTQLLLALVVLALLLDQQAMVLKDQVRYLVR